MVNHIEGYYLEASGTFEQFFYFRQMHPGTNVYANISLSRLVPLNQGIAASAEAYILYSRYYESDLKLSDPVGGGPRQNAAYIENVFDVVFVLKVESADAVAQVNVFFV